MFHVKEVQNCAFDPLQQVSMTRWLAYCFTAVLLGNEIHQYNNHEDYWIYFFMAASLFDTIMEENKPMWISPYLSHLHRVSFQAVDGFYQVVDAAVQAIRTSFRVSTSSPRMLHQVKVNVYSSIIPSPRFRYTPSYLPFFPCSVASFLQISVICSTQACTQLSFSNKPTVSSSCFHLSHISLELCSFTVILSQ